MDCPVNVRLKDCSDICSSVNRLAFFMGLIMNMVPSMHLQIDTEFMELIAFSTLKTRRTQLREWEIASESLEHLFFFTSISFGLQVLFASWFLLSTKDVFIYSFLFL